MLLAVALVLATLCHTTIAKGNHTHSATSSPSLSEEVTPSFSRSTEASLSLSRSLTTSFSKTGSKDLSATISVTSSASISVTTSSTQSFSKSASLSSTITDSPRKSSSKSESLTNFGSTTRTITPPPTPTPTSTPSLSKESTSTLTKPSPSSSASAHVSKSTPSNTMSASLAPSSSRSPSQQQSSTRTVTITPPPTNTPSPTFSSEASQSRTPNQTATPTPSSSVTWEFTPSKTASPTNTYSMSKEVTASNSPSFSESQTLTQSASLTASKDVTRSPTLNLTQTPALTMSPTWNLTKTNTISSSGTFSMSLSQQASKSITRSPSGTRSNSPTQTWSSSESQAVSKSVTMSPAITATPTASLSQTPSTSVSLSITPSEEPTLSKSPTVSQSPSTSSSLSFEVSRTSTLSPSVSMSTSTSTTDSLTASRSLTRDLSISRSQSCTISIGTITGVATESVDVSISKTKGTPSHSVSLTASQSLTSTTSNSLSVSRTMSLSLSRSVTLTQANSMTVSDTPSRSESLTDTYSLSNSFTSELSETRTLTTTETLSMTDTWSISQMNSITTTQTRTDESSATMSYPLTTSVQPPTTTHVPTPTFTLPTRCPGDCMKGTCRQFTAFTNQFVFFCVCQSSSATGYWSGSERGGPCDKCATGYFGLSCLNACPGGACSICSGHGTCDDGLLGAGTCTCFNDQVNGYWEGFACTSCKSGRYGIACNKNCTCGVQGTCSSGVVGDGSCKCNSGWMGANCTTCDISKNTDCNLNRTCPGGNNCNGNGVCNYNISDTVVCDCYPFYAGEDCSLHCSNNCSGHGICSDGRSGTGTCACNARYSAPDCGSCQTGYFKSESSCEGICPGVTDTAKACTSHGTCTNAGICICSGTWGGTACNLQCPTAAANATSVCAGHGTCNSVGTCTCYQSLDGGFWGGTACEFCDSNHGGISCRSACPKQDQDVEACGATSGFGTCNNLTATCDCVGTRCGVSCNVATVNGECPACADSTPERQLYGPQCDQICACNFGVCHDGLGGDGSCTCNRGWSGLNCNITCPGGELAPCSNNGVCVQVTSQCACNTSYAGTNCNITCPRTTYGICNGTGTCLDGSSGDGTCVCNDGWVWPNTTCTTACQCNGHGTCYYPNATCTCNTNFEGEHCERCTSGTFGASCENECIRGHGVTVGYGCRCLDGYAGSNGCPLTCPNTTAGVCNAHGSCNNITGACRCDGLWYGPGCTCNNDKCKSENSFTTCDNTLGTCVCVVGRTGTSCESCVIGYYGAPSGGVSCQTPCDCNQHGPCDLNTGVCNCFSDDINGHWTGGTCNQCVTGYMGTKCNQLSNAITQTTDLVRRLSDSVVSCTSFHSYLDSPRRLLYVGTTCFQARFNVTTVVPFSPESMTLTLTAPPNGTALYGDIVSLQVNASDPDELVFIMQQNSTANSYSPILYGGSVAPFLSNIALNTQASTSTDTSSSGTTVFAYHDQTISSFCIMPTGQARPSIYCKNTSTNVLKNFKPELNTQATAFVADLSMIVLGGMSTSVLPRCVLQAYRFDASQIALQSLQPHLDLPTDCTAVNVVAAADDIIFFSIKAPSNFIGGYNFTGRTFFNGSLIGGDTSGTAMTYIPEANIGYVVYNTLVVKFELVQSTMLGVVAPSVNAYGQAYTSTIIARFTTDAYLQLVYATAAVSKGVQVYRFLLVEVHSIYPVVADRAGGALITVTGKGFRNVTEARCYFDKDAVPFYRFIDSNTVVCRAPEKISSEVCLSQYLEISTNGVQTANQFTIERPASPTLSNVVPDFVRVGDAGRSVVIQGRGLRESNYSMCRFFDPVSGTAMLSVAVYSAANYTFTCIAPTVLQPWSASSYVHLTLDGFVFSVSTLKFLFVGEANGIVIDTPSFSAVSSVRSFLSPTLQVYVVDPNLNKLLTVDTSRRATVVSAPNSTTAGQPWVLENVNVTTIDGIATFSNLSLKDPPYGDFVFMVQMGNFTANFSLTIQPGEVVRLIVTTQPQQTASDIIVPGASLPRPMDIVAVDAGGNDAASAGSTVARFSLIRVSGGKLLINETTVLGSALFSATGSANVGSPVVTPTFGFPYVVFFWYDLNPLINVSTNEFYAGCPSTQFFVNGTQACQPCQDALFICNGTDTLVAREQSWRANAASVYFYTCPINGACLLGGACAVGYEGPLCAVCSEGYSKDFTDECDECPMQAISIVIFVLMVIFQLAFLVFVSIAFIQNWQAIDSLFTQAVVTMCISFSHFQFLSLIGKLDLEWMPIVKNILSFLGMLFAFELHRVRAVNCLLDSNGIDAVWFAMIYSFIVICAIPFLALVVHFILRAYPTLLLTGYALNARAVMESRADALAKAKLVKRARNKDGTMYVKEHQRKAILLNVAQVVVTFCFQTSCRSALQLFQCSSIRSSDTEVGSYLTADMRVSCDSENYKTVLGYSTFLVMFYVVVVPVVFIFGVAYSRKRHTEDDYRLYTSFTTLGTRDLAFFWNGLLFCRRAALIAIELFLEYPLQAWLGMWVVTLSAWAEHYTLPWEKGKHMNIERAGFMCSVFLANVGIILPIVGAPAATTTIEIFMMIAICSLFAFTLYAGLYKSLRELQQRVKEHNMRDTEGDAEDDVGLADVLRNETKQVASVLRNEAKHITTVVKGMVGKGLLDARGAVTKVLDLANLTKSNQQDNSVTAPPDKSFSSMPVRSQDDASPSGATTIGGGGSVMRRSGSVRSGSDTGTAVPTVIFPVDTSTEDANRRRFQQKPPRVMQREDSSHFDDVDDVESLDSSDDGNAAQPNKSMAAGRAAPLLNRSALSRLRSDAASQRRPTVRSDDGKSVDPSSLRRMELEKDIDDFIASKGFGIYQQDATENGLYDTREATTASPIAQRSAAMRALMKQRGTIPKALQDVIGNSSDDDDDDSDDRSADSDL